MKKVLLFTALLMFCVKSVKADTIIIMDDNNVVKQQVYTLPNTTVQTVQTTSTPAVVQTQPIYVTGAPLPPQQVVVTRPVPPVVVVRETQAPRNYYYDSTATAALAGFTGALVGSVVSGRGRHHHHHH